MEYWLIFLQNWIKNSNLGIYKVQQTPTSKKKITPYAHYTKLLKTTNEKKILKNTRESVPCILGATVRITVHFLSDTMEASRQWSGDLRAGGNTAWLGPSQPPVSR